MSLLPRVDSRAFRQIMTIEVQDTRQDEGGQQIRSWRLIKTIRADLHSVNGRELIAAQAMQAEATHLIETPYSPDLDVFQSVVAMRARLGSRLFDIKTCDNVDQMNRLTRMMANEGLNQG
jgi:SPP1 family predicted phage head-tail adaptor